MENKQAVKESLTTDLTKRLALTFLRAGCAVTGEPLGAKELETMDPVDRRGIEAGIEAVVAELAGMGEDMIPLDAKAFAIENTSSNQNAEDVARHVAKKASRVVAPVLAAKDAELARRDRKIADLEEHAAYVTGWCQEAEAKVHAAKQETDKSVKSANEWRLVAELADEIKNAAIEETDKLRAKLSEFAKATPDDLVPSPDEITRIYLDRHYSGKLDDGNLWAWREDATRLRNALLAKVAPAFNAQCEELTAERDSDRKWLTEYRAREKNMNHALDEAGIGRDQTTMQGTLQFWTLPERVGLLIVRDREMKMDLERVTAERGIATDAYNDERKERVALGGHVKSLEAERDGLQSRLRLEMASVDAWKAKHEELERRKDAEYLECAERAKKAEQERDTTKASLDEASDEILKLHQHLIDVRHETGLDDGWNSAPWSELPKRIAAKVKVSSEHAHASSAKEMQRSSKRSG